MALKPELVKLVPVVILLPTCEYVPELVLERYTLYPVAPLTADQLTVRLEEVELPTVRPLGVAGGVGGVLAAVVVPPTVAMGAAASPEAS